MSGEFNWSAATYEGSLSRRSLWYTSHDEGWGPAVANDEELREIVAMEQQVRAIPPWAAQLACQAIRYLPPCGHYSFPRPILECLSAIGTQTPPNFLHTCFTAGGNWKRAMQDYCLCLDAWLAGASPEDAAAELTAMASRSIAWSAVCQDLWKVLGERTEMKELLVERLLHAQRWKLKNSPWHDDACDQSGRDQYLGSFRPEGCYANEYACQRLAGFNERSSPRVKRLEARLVDTCPDWEWFGYTIQYGWICSPKAFRHLECLLWAIGRQRRCITTQDHPLPEPQREQVPPFLQCDDLYVDQDEAAAWWRAVLPALTKWWQQADDDGSPLAKEVRRRLEAITPVKRWLVRLLVRRLELMEQTSGSLNRLVRPSPTTRRGKRPLLSAMAEGPATKEQVE